MSEDDRQPMGGIVMLGDVNLPSRDALYRAIQARLPNVSPPADDMLDDAPLVLIEPGVLMTVMQFDLPCPVAPGDSCFGTAWYWPKAWETVQSHKAHLNVDVAGCPDVRTRAVLFGQLLAAVVEASPSALAVYCGDSDALWPAALVPGMAHPGSDDVPIHLCVSVRVSRDAAAVPGGEAMRLSARTQGLATFGLMEIETLNVVGDPKTLTYSLLDLATYLIDQGPVIQDGDTIGSDENTRLRVTYEDSRLPPGQKVYRVGSVKVAVRSRVDGEMWRHPDSSTLIVIDDRCDMASTKKKTANTVRYEMDSDEAGGVPGLKILNEKILEGDGHGLRLAWWPDGYLRLPRGPWLFREFVETPRLLFNKKLGRPPRDLENDNGVWVISAAMKAVLEEIDPAACDFRPCETLLPSGEPGRETWLCTVTRAFVGAVDPLTSENLSVRQGPEGLPAYSLML